jgi:hypothetical protein
MLLSVLLPLFLLTPVSAETYKNHFASILVDGKKIGQVHYMEVRNDEGVLQELKTRASLSIFKIEVYHHHLHTHEFWESGEMVHLWGTANENGKFYKIDLRRQSGGYTGILNEQDIQLPEFSFPTAVWHYSITEHRILFSIPELNLLHVNIKKSADNVRIGKQSIPAEKFEFSGDWNAIVWFDYDKQFLKWQYKVKGRKVIVLLDPSE